MRPRGARPAQLRAAQRGEPAAAGRCGGPLRRWNASRPGKRRAQGLRSGARPATRGRSHRARTGLPAAPEHGPGSLRKRWEQTPPSSVRPAARARMATRQGASARDWHEAVSTASNAASHPRRRASPACPRACVLAPVHPASRPARPQPRLRACCRSGKASPAPRGWTLRRDAVRPGWPPPRLARHFRWRRRVRPGHAGDRSVRVRAGPCPEERALA